MASAACCTFAALQKCNIDSFCLRSVNNSCESANTASVNQGTKKITQRNSRLLLSKNTVCGFYLPLPGIAFALSFCCSVTLL